MPPKKEATDKAGKPETLIKGFEDKETKLIAAAFLSTIGPDKFDYDLMHELTGNTVGSLKKMWPPVKRKAMDQHGSFAKYLGQTGTVAAAPAAAPKAAAGKKRKAASEDEAGEDNANSKGDSTEPNTATDKSDDNRSKAKKRGPPKEKKVPVAKKAAGRPRKQVKKEDVDDEAMADPEDNSADGGDGVDKEAEAEVEEEV